MLDHLQPNAMLAGGLGGVRFGVTLVDIGQLHRRSGDLLALLCQRGDLLAVALIGRRHLKCQQVASVSTAMCTFEPLRRLAPIVAGAGTALGCALQGTAVETDRRGLAFSLRPLAGNRLHIADQHLEHARIQPSPHLLVDRPPRAVLVCGR